MTALADLSAVDVGRLVATREVSAGEVLDAALERHAALEPALHAFCTPTPELARAQAAAIDAATARGETVGPLAGVPLAIKDLISTAGIRTAGGSLRYADFVPDQDDVVVERVRGAGALIMGKTNVSELGYGPVGHNPVFATTRNPWDPARASGGSSAGSAVAVATGMSALALGSDGGGSIRIPAALCGVVGVKASMGRVPLYPGCRDTRYPGFSSWESLEHIGPLGRTVADAALLLSVIAGPDPRDRLSIPTDDVDWPVAARPLGDTALGRLRIGFSADWGYTPVDPAVRAVARGAADVLAEDLGCRVEPVVAPWDDPADVFEALVALESDLTGMRQMADRLGPSVTSMLEQRWTAERFTDALTARKRLCNAMWPLMREYDVLLTPTLAGPAPTADATCVTVIDGQPAGPQAWNAFTYIANLTGQPAVSLPAGFDADGMPVGVQLIGRHLGDEVLLRLSAAFEAVVRFPAWTPR